MIGHKKGLNRYKKTEVTPCILSYDPWLRLLFNNNKNNGKPKKHGNCWAVVALAFNPNTWEAKAGGFLSSRPDLSTEWVPEQPELYREILFQKTKKQTNKKHGKLNNALLNDSLVKKESILESSCRPSYKIPDHWLFFTTERIITKSMRLWRGPEEIVKVGNMGEMQRGGGGARL